MAASPVLIAKVLDFYLNVQLENNVCSRFSLGNKADTQTLWVVYRINVAHISLGATTKIAQLFLGPSTQPILCAMIVIPIYNY
ncbi:hypothetical protein QEG73_01360 [Chitinophagaceae bacterium 26-R-25]|nr:hypothetical protein [Chitinophagaceae bacterium 26-R-25]